MVTRIMKSAGSVRAPLEYNEDKVLEGEADVVCVRNVDSDTQFAIKQAMTALEENPAVSAKTKNFSFHMTVNPGPGDDMDTDDIVAYVDEAMAALGMSGQPYVIYRHHDIEREHYHIVSVRVDREGKVISDSFNHPRMMAAQRRLAEKYGFTIGTEDIEARNGLGLPAPESMRRGMANVTAQIRANVEEVLTWHVENALQLRAAMMSYGVRMMRKDNPDEKKKKKARYWSFTPMDADGKAMSWPIKGSRIVDKLFNDRVVACMKRSREDREPGERTFIAEAVKVSIAEARSVREVRNALAQVGLFLYVDGGEGRVLRSSKGITAACVVDAEGHRVYSITEGRLALDRLRVLPIRKAEDRDEPLAEDAVRRLRALRGERAPKKKPSVSPLRKQEGEAVPKRPEQAPVKKRKAKAPAAEPKKKSTKSTI